MGTKSLNQILEHKTSSLKHKTGLGFDPYAHSKNNTPTVVRSLCSGKIEICGEPKRMVFKSAGIMSSTSTMTSTSQNIKSSTLALIVVEMDIKLSFVLD